MSRSVALALHVVQALSHMQRAVAELGEARRALAPVQGLESSSDGVINGPWSALLYERDRIAHVMERLRRSAAAPSVALAAEHSGVGCEACACSVGARDPEQLGEPESHGERRLP